MGGRSRAPFAFVSCISVLGGTLAPSSVAEPPTGARAPLRELPAGAATLRGPRTRTSVAAAASPKPAVPQGAPFLGEQIPNACPPNDMLISCKQPVTTYGPLSPLGGSDAGGARRRPRLSAALAG